MLELNLKSNADWCLSGMCEYSRMDHYVRRLIALRKVLRNSAAKFHDLMEANERSMQPNGVDSVRDLIEASMNTIDEMPITPRAACHLTHPD
jgi:hypothetical protein